VNSNHELEYTLPWPHRDRFGCFSETNGLSSTRVEGFWSELFASRRSSRMLVPRARRGSPSAANTQYDAQVPFDAVYDLARVTKTLRREGICVVEAGPDPAPEVRGALWPAAATELGRTGAPPLHGTIRPGAEPWENTRSRTYSLGGEEDCCTEAVCEYHASTSVTSSTSVKRQPILSQVG